MSLGLAFDSASDRDPGARVQETASRAAIRIVIPTQSPGGDVHHKQSHSQHDRVLVREGANGVIVQQESGQERIRQEHETSGACGDDVSEDRRARVSLSFNETQRDMGLSHLYVMSSFFIIAR